MNRFLTLSWVPWLCFLAALPFARGQTSTVFTGARIIDGTGRAPLENATLTIRDGRIVSILPTDNSVVPAGARIIDVRGRTIIPGLISAHSHLGLVKGAAVASAENYTRENVARQLAQYEGYGVTAVMSLGVNRDALYDWRNEQRAGSLPGADIFTADCGLGVTGGTPPFPVPGDQVYRPGTAEEARADVREMAARHARPPTAPSSGRPTCAACWPRASGPISWCSKPTRSTTSATPRG